MRGGDGDGHKWLGWGAERHPKAEYVPACTPNPTHLAPAPCPTTTTTTIHDRFGTTWLLPTLFAKDPLPIHASCTRLPPPSPARLCPSRLHHPRAHAAIRSPALLRPRIRRGGGAISHGLLRRAPRQRLGPHHQDDDRCGCWFHGRVCGWDHPGCCEWEAEEE